MNSQREPGITLKDIARIAQVHPATVSRALDPARDHLVTSETKAQIRDIAEQMGYKVNALARSLRKGSSGLIGVVVADVANPFLAPVLRGIEGEVRGEGYMLIISETHDQKGNLSEVLEHFASRRVDAVIVTSAHLSDYETLRSAAESLPVILAVRSLEVGCFPTVTHDDFLGGQLAAQHLFDLGHRNIAQLKGPIDVSSFKGRQDGYNSILAKTTARDLSDETYAENPTIDEGYKLASSLLLRTKDRPTAIFAHNDLMAVGAIKAARELKIICPAEVSIVGYNDAPLSDYLTPALTTIKLPAFHLGQKAAQLALSALQGEELTEPPERLPPELIVRSSTDRAPIE